MGWAQQTGVMATPFDEELQRREQDLRRQKDALLRQIFSLDEGELADLILELQQRLRDRQTRREGPREGPQQPAP